jgi:hypothetical protein
MRHYFLAILLLFTFIGVAQESILGDSYFGDFWQPQEKSIIRIKPDNKFQIVSVTSTPNKVSETALVSGNYLLQNDTLILKLSDQKIVRFKVLQNLALKPLNDNSDWTSNWFLLKNKIDKNGRYLGEGKWQNDQKLSVWIYSDKRYSDVQNPKTKTIDYSKLKK